MSYEKHNAIVITGSDSSLISAAAAKAEELYLQVLGPSEAVVNGFRSILICPDGSKEGWEESDIGDKRRADFKAWLNSRRFEDGSTQLHWVEVEYSSDTGNAIIAEHAWL